MLNASQAKKDEELQTFCSNNCLEVCRFLVGHGANVNGIVNFNVPLQCARTAEMCEFLLTEGADVHLDRNPRYNFPLLYHAENFSIVAVLVAWGAAWDKTKLPDILTELPTYLDAVCRGAWSRRLDALAAYSRSPYATSWCKWRKMAQN